jgi:hypothetical protein
LFWFIGVEALSQNGSKWVLVGLDCNGEWPDGIQVLLGQLSLYPGYRIVLAFRFENYRINCDV